MQTQTKTQTQTRVQTRAQRGISEALHSCGTQISEAGAHTIEVDQGDGDRRIGLDASLSKLGPFTKLNQVVAARPVPLLELIDLALRDSNRHHRCYRLVPVIPQLHHVSQFSVSSRNAAIMSLRF